ncbi:MAG: hypothetical protein AB9860_03050 [Methanomassiliicoccales archaeon]
MSFDHRTLFKVFLLASSIAVIIWLLELPFDIIPGPMGFVVLFIGVPIILAFLIAATLVAAIIERSHEKKVSLIKCGAYLTIYVVLISWIFFCTFLVIRGFVD